MTTPEKSVNHQEKRIDDMHRPMIGVIRMHMTDFDAQSEVVVTNVDEQDSLIQPDALVLSSGTVIPKRYSKTVQTVELADDISENSIVYSTDRTSNTNIRLNKKSKRIVRSSVTLVVGASLVAACASFLTEKDGQDTLQPMPTNTFDSTTIPAETTTTTTTLQAAIVECIVNGQGQIVVEPGQNMSQIAAACGRSLGELMEWNALTDADNINAGQILVVTPPTTTTTIPPTTTPVETTPVETTPPETLPIEVAPPESIAVESVPPTTQKLPETYLTRQECTNLGGKPVQFPGDGSGSWATLKNYYNLTDYQVGRIMKTEIPTKFHINEITATPVYECMPDPSIILAAAPMTAAPTT